jgi:hypothetical protein
MSRKPLNRTWTDDEIAELRRLHGEGFPVWRIAARLKRPEKSIRGRLSELGLSKRREAAPAADAAAVTRR